MSCLTSSMLAPAESFTPLSYRCVAVVAAGVIGFPLHRRAILTPSWPVRSSRLGRLAVVCSALTSVAAIFMASAGFADLSPYLAGAPLLAVTLAPSAGAAGASTRFVVRVPAFIDHVPCGVRPPTRRRFPGCAS
jgi:hypothetical protein